MFQVIGGAWVPVLTYPVPMPAYAVAFKSEPLNSTATFLACYSVNGQASFPGQGAGCDATPTTVDPPPPVF